MVATSSELVSAPGFRGSKSNPDLGKNVLVCGPLDPDVCEHILKAIGKTDNFLLLPNKVEDNNDETFLLLTC